MPKKSLKEVQAMTPEEKKEYQRQLNKERVAKYRSIVGDTPEYKKKNAETVYKFRNAEENYEEYKKKNVEYNKKYRERLRQEKKQVEALNTLSNAIKNRKAKKEMEQLKEEKKAKDLLNSISKDTLLTATTATAKKGRPKGAKNKPVDTVKYNLRSRGK